MVAAIEELVQSAPPPMREELTAELLAELRERVRAVREDPTSGAPAPAASASANPFALGIPLAMVGFLLLILFPPVGIVLVGFAAVVMAWGLVSGLILGRLRAWR